VTELQTDRSSDRSSGLALIDADVHVEVPRVEVRFPHLPEHWVEHLETFGAHGPGGGAYPRFLNDREGSWPPSGRKAGSEPAFVRDTFLEPERCAYAILTPLGGGGGLMNLDLSAAWARAVNDWQAAEWLDFDPRFRASIQISFEDPPRAVEEIRRRASDKRFVQVQFSGRPHEPMGRRKYWPI
jgi:uncharacterized protein